MNDELSALANVPVNVSVRERVTQRGDAPNAHTLRGVTLTFKLRDNMAVSAYTQSKLAPFVVQVMGALDMENATQADIVLAYMSHAPAFLEAVLYWTGEEHHALIHDLSSDEYDALLGAALDYYAPIISGVYMKLAMARVSVAQGEVP